MASLSSEQVAFYRDQGYLILKAVFDSQIIKSIQNDADRLLNNSDIVFPENIRCRWQESNTPGTPLEALDPIIDLSPATHKLAYDDFLIGSIAQLLDETTYLFKDKLIYKLPGSSGYTLHQDYITWAEFPKTCTIALVALDPSDEETGCLELWPGWHKYGYLSPENGEYNTIPDSWMEGKQSIMAPLQPGDVMFFNCLLPHRSAPNRSDRARRHLYLSYHGASDGGEQRDEYYRLQMDWFKEKFDHNRVFK